MNRRDEFAKAALAGLLADPNVTGKMSAVSKLAYEVADAMIAESGEGGEELPEVTGDCVVLLRAKQMEGK